MNRLTTQEPTVLPSNHPASGGARETVVDSARRVPSARGASAGRPRPRAAVGMSDSIEIMFVNAKRESNSGTLHARMQLTKRFKQPIAAKCLTPYSTSRAAILSKSSWRGSQTRSATPRR